MAGYQLAGNRRNFVRVEGASLWLFKCQHHLSPLYVHKGKCFDNITIFSQDTLYYIDPISLQTCSSATEIPCFGNPANLIALDHGGNE